jgi:phosphatidate cytidylyltransferase
MNPVPHFVNPFANQVALSSLLRLAMIYGAAILAALFLFRGSIKRILASNVGQRIVGWLLLTPLYFVGTFAGGIPGLLVLLLFLYGAISEYAHIAKLDNRFRNALLLLSVTSVFIAGFTPSLFYALPLIYFLVITPLAIRLNKPEASFLQAAIAMYGAIWLIFSLCHLVLLTRLSTTHFDNTHALTFVVIFAVALADIGGYVFGKLFHRLNILDSYKVADKLSPNKTYIGTLGYVIGAAAGIWLFYSAVGHYMTNLQWAFVAVIIGVFSFIGGLTHSYFKRYFGVKDSGHIIPGHGGVMDRIDSISRVGVILYYFLLAFVVK